MELGLFNIGADLRLNPHLTRLQKVVNEVPNHWFTNGDLELMKGEGDLQGFRYYRQYILVLDKARSF